MGEEGVWGPELAELRRREAFAELMGGEEKVARQHDRGKLDVRQRIGRLLDTGSFHEIGKIAGTPTYDADGELVDLRASNFVFGRGLVDGRTVVVAADDFTVRGGAADASIIAKQIAAEQMALELRLPIVRLIDGTGGGGSVKTLDTKADEKGSNIVGSIGRGSRTYVPFNPAWDLVVSNLATVPTVALCLGPVAGLGAARAVTSHYSVMVRGLSQLFVAGPPVVNRLGGEQVDKESLGGSRIHTRNGAIDDEVRSEDEAFERARRFLSYLPSSVFELPGRGPATDDPDRTDDTLGDVVPRDRRQVYKMRTIIESVADTGSFFEMGAGFGRSAICGLARLDGWPVAILAGDPYHYGGGWTADSARRAPCRQPGVRDRHRVREGRHDPPRCTGAGGDLPGDRALVFDPGTQGLRRGRSRPLAGPQVPVPVCVAFGGLGVVAGRRWRRGRLQVRAGGLRRSGGPAGRDHRPPERREVTVPHRRGLPG